MINIVSETVKYYLENWKRIWDGFFEEYKEKQEKSKPMFVTIYKNWEVIGSAWTIKETEENMVLEIIENSISAIKDKRFWNIKKEDFESLKFRIDIISSRTQLKPSESKIEDLNPVNNWVIAIKSDYKKIAVILPNISNKINTWNDLIEVLSQKLDEKFDRNYYSTYSIVTEQITNF